MRSRQLLGGPGPVGGRGGMWSRPAGLCVCVSAVFPKPRTRQPTWLCHPAASLERHPYFAEFVAEDKPLGAILSTSP